MDSFEWNKIAAGVLLASIAGLVAVIFSGYMFKHHPLEAQAYPIEGVVEEGGAEAGVAEDSGPPLAVLLASANVENGAKQFKKCTACHTIEQGGANKTGPNLFGVMGGPHAHVKDFNYSDAMKSRSAVMWGWEEIDAYIENPRGAIPGNKMSFAGIRKAQDRADLLAYLNQNDDTPLPLPAPPVETAAPAEDAAAAPEGEVPADDAAAPVEAATAG